MESKVEIRWNEVSVTDLEKLYDYIAFDSPTYARQQIEQILGVIKKLTRFPKLGKHLLEFPNLPYREIIISNYRIIYRYNSIHKIINIITIIHGARLLKKQFLK